VVEYYFTRRELHDDRMAIFQTWMPQGSINTSTY